MVTDFSAGSEMYEKIKAVLESRPGFMEMVDPGWFAGPPSLFICGAGHIAKAVAGLAASTDFKVTVFDSYPQYLRPENFPAGADLICDGVFALGNYLKPPYVKTPYYGICAMGHDSNLIHCVRAMLQSDFKYLGVLCGSGVIEAIKKQLMTEGFTREQLDVIHAPIGLPIRAITPKEIAISIMAEVISVKNVTKQVPVVSEELLTCRENGCLCMIVKQTEHVPRGVGSLMYVTADRVYDSLGGADTERKIIARAREMIPQEAGEAAGEEERFSGGKMEVDSGGNEKSLYAGGEASLFAGDEKEISPEIAEYDHGHGRVTVMYVPVDWRQ